MTNYSHRDKTEEWDFAHTERAMTDATALAQLLRSHANEPWMTIGGRPFAAEAAALLDSLSQRLAAAQRERDDIALDLECSYNSNRSLALAWANAQGKAIGDAERRNLELVERVDTFKRERDTARAEQNYFMKLASDQHDIDKAVVEAAERRNAELARHEEAVEDAVTLLLACLIFLPPISLSSNISSLYSDIDKWLARNDAARAAIEAFQKAVAEEP